MIFTETKIKGAYIIEVNRLQDDRGFFGRSYCQNEFEKHGLNTHMVQVNISNSKNKGTLRGLHMQRSPYSEAKLVRCTRGAIYDVILDMREDSETFRQWLGVELLAEDYKMLYLPEGCAHGYLTLIDDTDVMYQVTQFYSPGAEVGFLWNDPAFNIEWPIDPVIISIKDQKHMLFEQSMIDAGYDQKSILL